MNRQSRRAGAAADKNAVLAQSCLLRGLQYHEKSELAQAVSQYQRVLAIDADNAQALHFLGLARLQQGRADLAEAVLRRAVRPGGDAAIWSALGDALRAQEKSSDAVDAYGAALAADPANAAVWLHLGVVQQQAGQIEAAIAAYRRALALAPDLPEACSNLGFALHEQGDLAGALDILRRAVSLRPHYAEAWFNLGNTLRDLKRGAEADAAYANAIDQRPGWADPGYNRALVRLAAGDLARGWSDYNLRFRTTHRPVADRGLAQPHWRGEPLEGKSLLVWGEQGIGDEILHGTMLPDLYRRVGPFVLECAPRLAGLFARALPGVTIIPCGDPLPDTDLQIPLGGLGPILRPSLDAFAAQSPLFTADAGRTAALRADYRQLGAGPVIGLSWKSAAFLGAEKTSPLTAWGPVLRDRTAVFVSLQYGDCAADLAALRQASGIDIHRDDRIDPLRDLDGAAAQIAACDLVISVSNSTVHLAGALGVPCWAVLPHGAGLLWYWFETGERSPWYPSVKLYRPSAPGDWTGVFTAVAADLGRDR